MQTRRERYQQGSVRKVKRAKGFAWEFRYYVEESGKRVPKSQYFDGKLYKTATAVRQKVEAQLLQLNDGTEYARANDVSFNALLERYIAEEMPERHATKGGYTSIINAHLRPTWGSHMVSDIRPAEIHKWFQSLSLAPITKGHVRSLMHKLGTVTIRRSAYRGSIAETKNTSSKAKLPLHPTLAALLLAWKEKCKKDECEFEWLFANPYTGMPYMSPSLQQRWIRPAGEALGIEGLGFHSLRHSYRSWLDSAGVAPGVTKDLMRHSAIATTFNVYGRALSPEKREGNRKVVEMLLPPPMAESTQAEAAN
jgi:hypothetical protein